MSYLLDRNGAGELLNELRSAAGRAGTEWQVLANTLAQVDLPHDVLEMLTRAQERLSSSADVLDTALDRAQQPVLEPQLVAAAGGFGPLGPLAATTDSTIVLAADSSQTRSLDSSNPFYLGWPFSAAGRELNIAGIGNSFLSGEGTFNYIRPGDLPSIHQSPQAGVVQAIEQLQEQYPTATLRITYSADPGTTHLVPPRSGAAGGQVINLNFVAESGATSADMLGLTRNDRTDSPLIPQYLAAAGAHVIILEGGGNDADVVGMLRPALTGDGAAAIDASTASIPDATALFPVLLNRVLAESEGAQVLVTGYPNVFTPVNGDAATGPLNPGAANLTRNLDTAELAAIARWGWTLNNSIAGYVNDSAGAGNSVTFINPWGTWGQGDTVGAPNALVNDYIWGQWYWPDPPAQETYHPNLRGNAAAANALFPHLLASAEPVLGLPLDVRHQLSYVSPEDPILQSLPAGVSFWQPSAPPGEPLPPAEQALLFMDPPVVDPWQTDGSGLGLDTFGGTGSYPFSLPLDLGTDPDTYWDDVDFNDIELYGGDSLSPADYLP